MKPDPIQKVLESGPGPLSRIMSLDETTLPGWRTHDLQAMLRHQLATPLAFDLPNVIEGEEEATFLQRALNESERLGIKSFRDLLDHRTPPLRLLEFAKTLFKRQSGASSQRRPEQQVAYVLYLLAILSARLHCGKVITKLTDAELLRMIAWAMNLEWVDDETKAVLAQARASLG